MVLPKRKSILTKEERITRLKESRLKYSQLGKAKNTSVNQNEAKPSSSVAAASSVQHPPTRPAIISKPPAAPRASIAPKPSGSLDFDADFEVDPNSLAMIKSGRITIPTSRPSISASRHTIGSRQSISGRSFSRFRASIALEPRPSLLPLGINVFEASANQRNEVSDFLNSRISTTTPAKPSNSSSASANVFSGVLNSTRSKKIRFMETAIQEVRESAESAEVAAVSTSIHHSPITDTLFMPTSILSTKKNIRKKVNLGDCPAPTPRKIVFEDEEDSTDEPEKENIEGVIEEFERMVKTLSDPHKKLTEDNEKRVRTALEKLRKSLDLRLEQTNQEVMPSNFKSPLKLGLATTSIPMTPLGSILENVNLEDSPDLEEIEFLERKKKKLRRSSKMKVGSDARRSVMHRRSSRGGKQLQE